MRKPKPLPWAKKDRIGPRCMVCRPFTPADFASGKALLGRWCKRHHPRNQKIYFTAPGKFEEFPDA